MSVLNYLLYLHNPREARPDRPVVVPTLRLHTAVPLLCGRDQDWLEVECRFATAKVYIMYS